MVQDPSVTSGGTQQALLRWLKVQSVRCNAALCSCMPPMGMQGCSAGDAHQRLFPAQDHGLPEQRVVVSEVQQEGQTLDVTVANGHLEPG